MELPLGNNQRFKLAALSFINPGESFSTSANQNLCSEFFEISYPNGSTTQCWCWLATASIPTLSSAAIRVRNFKNSDQNGGYNFLQGYYKAQWLTEVEKLSLGFIKISGF